MSGTATLEGARNFGKWVYLKELDYYSSVLMIISSPHSLCLPGGVETSLPLPLSLHSAQEHKAGQHGLNPLKPCSGSILPCKLFSTDIPLQQSKSN